MSNPEIAISNPISQVSPVYIPAAVSVTSTPPSTFCDPSALNAVCAPQENNEYQLIVPPEMRDAINQISSASERQVLMQQALDFFNGNLIFRAIAYSPEFKSESQKGLRLCGVVIDDQDQKSYLFLDPEQAEFKALTALYRLTVPVKSAPADKIPLNSAQLESFLHNFLQDYSSKLEGTITALGKLNAEEAAEFIESKYQLFKKLAEEFGVELPAVLNTESASALAAQLKAKLDQFAALSGNDLIVRASTLISLVYEVEEQKIAQYLTMIRDGKFMLGYHDFGTNNITPLVKKEFELSYAGAEGQNIEVAFSGYIFIDSQSMSSENGVSPFLKLLAGVYLGEASANFSNIFEKLNGFPLAILSARTIPLVSAQYTQPENLRLYFSGSNYMVVSGTEVLIENIDGNYTLSVAADDPRLEKIRELLRQAGYSQDILNGTLAFIEEHAEAILGKSGLSEEEANINQFQDTAFNQYAAKYLSSDNLETNIRILKRAEQLTVLPQSARKLMCVFLYMMIGGLFGIEKLKNLSSASLYLLMQKMSEVVSGGMVVGDHTYPVTAEQIDAAFSLLDRIQGGENQADIQTFQAFAYYAKEVLRPLMEKGDIKAEEIFGATEISLYGVGQRLVPVSEEDRSILLDEITSYRDIEFEQSVVAKKLGSNYRGIELSQTAMKELQKAAIERAAIHNVSFQAALQDSAVWQAATLLDPEIMDPMLVVYYYVKNTPQLYPAGFADRLLKFVNGKEELSGDDWMTLLRLISTEPTMMFLSAAVAELRNAGQVEAIADMWQKVAGGEWSFYVDMDGDGNLYPAQNPSSSVSPAGAGAQLMITETENIEFLKHDPIANLWLFVFDRNPQGLPPDERILFPTIPAWLSPGTIRALAELLKEKYFLFTSLSTAGENQVREMLDGQSPVALSETEKELLRTLILMKGSGAVSHKILTAGQRMTLAGLIDKLPAGTAKNELSSILAHLITITPPIDVDELIIFADELEAQGKVLTDISQAPQVLRNYAELLMQGTFVTPEIAPKITGPASVMSNIWHGFKLGMEQSTMVQEPDKVTDFMPQEMISSLKQIMFLDCLMHLEGQAKTDLEEANIFLNEYNTLIERRSQLLERKDAIERDILLASPDTQPALREAYQGQLDEINALLAENTGFLSEWAEEFKELLFNLADRIPAAEDPMQLGARMAYLYMLVNGAGAVANTFEIQREMEFDLLENKNQQAVDQLTEKYKPILAQINQLRETHEMELFTLSNYMSNEEIDARFMEAFIINFAPNNEQGDYGIFEWNYESLPQIMGSAMLLKDAQGGTLENAEELFNFIIQAFGDAGSRWISLRKQPGDSDEQMLAKQALAAVLLNMPFRSLDVNLVSGVLNLGGGLLQHFVPATKKLVNPITFGVLSAASEGLNGLLGGSLSYEIEATSLEQMQAIVSTKSGRLEYQAVQNMEAFAASMSDMSMEMGGMANLLFGKQINFEAGQSGFEQAQHINWQVVDGAIDRYARLLAEIENDPAKRTQYEGLCEAGKATIELNETVLASLRALRDHLKSKGLSVSLFDALHAVNAFEGMQGVPSEVRLGITYLSMFTMDISVIEEKIMGMAMPSALDSVTGYSPESVLVRYQIEGTKVTIIRIDPTDPTRRIIIKYDQESMTADLAQGARIWAEEFFRTDEEGVPFEGGDAVDMLEEFGTESVNFGYIIPAHIFSGFSHMISDLAKILYMAAEYGYGANDTSESELAELQMKMLSKSLMDNFFHTWGSFAAFELNPMTFMSQFFLLWKNDKGKALGYGAMILPFVLGIIHKDIRYVKMLTDFFRGNPVAMAKWHQYGLASFPLAEFQNLLSWLSKKGVNKGLAGKYNPLSAAANGLNALGQTKIGKAAGKVAGVGGKVLGYASIPGNVAMNPLYAKQLVQGYLGKQNLINAYIDQMKAGIRQGLVEQGLTGAELEAAYDQALTEFNKMLKNKDLAIKKGIKTMVRELQMRQAQIAQMMQAQGAAPAQITQVLKEMEIRFLTEQAHNSGRAALGMMELDLGVHSTALAANAPESTGPAAIDQPIITLVGTNIEVTARAANALEGVSPARLTELIKALEKKNVRFFDVADGTVLNDAAVKNLIDNLPSADAPSGSIGGLPANGRAVVAVNVGGQVTGYSITLYEGMRVEMVEGNTYKILLNEEVVDVYRLNNNRLTRYQNGFEYGMLPPEQSHFSKMAKLRKKLAADIKAQTGKFKSIVNNLADLAAELDSRLARVTNLAANSIQFQKSLLDAGKISLAEFESRSGWIKSQLEAERAIIDESRSSLSTTEAWAKAKNSTAWGKFTKQVLKAHGPMLGIILGITLASNYKNLFSAQTATDLLAAGATYGAFIAAEKAVATIFRISKAATGAKALLPGTIAGAGVAGVLTAIEHGDDLLNGGSTRKLVAIGDVVAEMGIGAISAAVGLKAAAAGAVCGPYAVACSPVFGLVAGGATYFGLEYLKDTLVGDYMASKLAEGEIEEAMAFMGIDFNIATDEGRKAFFNDKVVEVKDGYITMAQFMASWLDSIKGSQEGEITLGDVIRHKGIKQLTLHDWSQFSPEMLVNVVLQAAGNFWQDNNLNEFDDGGHNHMVKLSITLGAGQTKVHRDSFGQQLSVEHIYDIDISCQRYELGLDASGSAQQLAGFGLWSVGQQSSATTPGNNWFEMGQPISAQYDVNSLEGSEQGINQSAIYAGHKAKLTLGNLMFYNLEVAVGNDSGALDSFAKFKALRKELRERLQLLGYTVGETDDDLYAAIRQYCEENYVPLVEHNGKFGIGYEFARRLMIDSGSSDLVTQVQNASPNLTAIASGELQITVGDLMSYPTLAYQLRERLSEVLGYDVWPTESDLLMAIGKYMKMIGQSLPTETILNYNGTAMKLLEDVPDPSTPLNADFARRLLQDTGDNALVQQLEEEDSIFDPEAESCDLDQ